MKFDGEPVHFEPGQYLTIGVVVDGKLLQRPYSVASAPQVSGTDGYEFYVRLVPVIRFTTALWRLPIGHRMRMIGPKGKFLLEPDDERAHLYVSTGTGIAPFISMIRDTMLRGDRRRRRSSLHGCSFADELGYRDVPRGARARPDVPCDLRPDDLEAGRSRGTRAGPGGPAGSRASSPRCARTSA